jgi:hypothetical protein
MAHWRVVYWFPKAEKTGRRREISLLRTGMQSRLSSRGSQLLLKCTVSHPPHCMNVKTCCMNTVYIFVRSSFIIVNYRIFGLTLSKKMKALFTLRMINICYNEHMLAICTFPVPHTTGYPPSFYFIFFHWGLHVFLFSLYCMFVLIIRPSYVILLFRKAVFIFVYFWNMRW